MRDKIEMTCEKATFSLCSACRPHSIPSAHLHPYSIPMVRNCFICSESHERSSFYILQSCLPHVLELLQLVGLSHVRPIFGSSWNLWLEVCFQYVFNMCSFHEGLYNYFPPSKTGPQSIIISGANEGLFACCQYALSGCSTSQYNMVS